jgi:putative flippase GtrA
MLQKCKEIFQKYREQILYLVFGGLTTVVDFAVSFLLYRLWLDGFNAPDGFLHLADLIAWAAAVAFAYVTNRIWVFESKRRGFVPIVGEIAAFAGGRVFTLLLQEVLMAIFFTWLGFNEYIVKIVAAVLVVILNYFISKIFVFRKKNG